MSFSTVKAVSDKIAAPCPLKDKDRKQAVTRKANVLSVGQW